MFSTIGKFVVVCVLVYLLYKFFQGVYLNGLKETLFDFVIGPVYICLELLNEFLEWVFKK